MRNLYKTYHKFFIVDGQNEDIEKFKKVWQIFQTDEFYSEFMQENKNLIFRDP